MTDFEFELSPMTYEDGEMVEAINKECVLCGEIYHVDYFEEDRCKFCEEENDD